MTWQIPKEIARVDDGDGSAWVLPEATGIIMHLSPSALEIWAACAGATAAEEVVEALVEREGWEPDVIRGHVIALVEALQSNKLLNRETR